uniref:Uncharacterized protein n=1 Tax=Lepeophtheirus salmonis TaxID=72036 RepID=A0A0K2UGZ4_LEPSM
MAIETVARLNRRFLAKTLIGVGDIFMDSLRPTMNLGVCFLSLQGLWVLFLYALPPSSGCRRRIPCSLDTRTSS